MTREIAWLLMGEMMAGRPNPIDECKSSGVAAAIFSPTALPADTAAALDVPELRVDGDTKVTGRARYVADVRLPGMLWARFLGSPHPHARVVSVDTSAAKAVPGVHVVIAGHDIGPQLFGRVLCDWPVLAYDRVRFVGDRVAAVAAETPEAAEEAINRIEVVYEELPAVFDAEEALGEGAPVLHPDYQSYFFRGKRRPVPHPNSQGHASYQKGEPDIGRLFANAHLVVEDVYTGARQHQGFIEPHGCVVWIDESGLVQVVSTNKSPFSLREQMAKAIGLPADRFVVDSQTIGGDFGGKGTSIEEFACYHLARISGRPVRAIMSYAEELTAANPQHGAKYYLRTAVTREGRIVAHDGRAYMNAGAYGGGRPNPENTAGGGGGSLDVYNVPNARIESYMVYTNLVPSGNMRAPGAFHRGHAGEAHMDHIARELDMDPLELRLRNALRPGDTTIHGEPVHEPRAVEVLEALRREARWGETPSQPNRAATSGVGRPRWCSACCPMGPSRR
ncbi:MAG: hypothetical protein HW416_1573 [Chloroflexi bacterium]|nr:hypothetical protein [Chloroflexota bacterium]